MKKLYILFTFIIFLFPLSFAQACDFIRLDTCKEFSIENTIEPPLFEEDKAPSLDDLNFADSPIRFSIHGRIRNTIGGTFVRERP